MSVAQKEPHRDEEDTQDINFLSSVRNRDTGYYELKKMKQIHHEIAMLALLGKSQREIAQALDVTAQMVGYTLDSRIVQDKLDVLRKERDDDYTDIQKRIRELQPLALDEIEHLLINPNTDAKEKRLIAQDLLDRGGNQAVDVTADASDIMSTKDINEIKQRAKKGGFMVEDVEEAEVIEEETKEDIKEED